MMKAPGDRGSTRKSWASQGDLGVITMIFQLPPPVLPAEVMGMSRIETATIHAECEKNSRDCFPGDLVGVVPEVVTVLSLRAFVPAGGLLTGTDGQGQ